MVSKLAHIPEDQIKKYALAHKIPPIDAYRALFSQALLDKLDSGETVAVLKELIYQVVGEGAKKAGENKTIQQMMPPQIILPPGTA